MLAIFTSNNAREKLMTIFNWLAETWATPLDNQEAETTTTEYGSENSYSQSYSQEQEPEQRAPGMFDWIFGSSSEQEQTQTHYEETETKSEQSYYQEPEQKAPGMFDWFWGTPEQNSEPEPLQNSYQQATNEFLNIQGDEEFAKKVTRAYNYLDAEDRAFVRENTKHIMQHARVSGAFPISKIVMLGGEVLERDEKSIAGVLVHEAKHNTNGPIANSQQEELDCIARQIATLRKIGGCEAEIAALEREDGNHYLD